MKKRFLSGMMLAGIIVGAGGLAACGQQTTRSAVTKDDLLEKAVDTFTQMKSLDADVDADMDIKISATGISMEMKYLADFDVVGTKDGVSHISGNMDVSGMGLDKTLELENYTVKENDEMLRYSKVNEAGTEGTWTYSKLSDIGEADITSEMSISQLADAYNKLKDSLSELKLENGTVSYNNTDCYLVSGKIKGDKLTELISSSDQEIDDETRKNISMIDLDTELYFKAKDETPYAIEMDMGEAIEKIIAAQADNSLGMEISVDSMKFKTIFNSFDSSDDIKIPDDVKNNAVESADALNVQDLLMGGGF